MDKVLYYTLRREDLDKTAGGLVNLVLKNCVKVTGHEISAAKFTPDGITCDGVLIRVSERMQPGQTLRVVLPEEKDETKLIPTPGPVRVLYEDEDLIAVDKAAGEVVHPGPGHYTDTAANYVTWYLQQKGRTDAAAGAGLRVIGRLDKETSGVLIFAKNRAAAARLQRQRRDGTFVRTYLAVCEGLFADDPGEKGALPPAPVSPEESEESDTVPEPVNPEQPGESGTVPEPGDPDATAVPGEPDAASMQEDPEISETAGEETWYKRGTINRPLEKEPGVLMRMRIAEEGCGLHAVTHYEVLAEMVPSGHDAASCSLLRITIETGRTHQIRVHMASIGHPLVGDTLYGSAARQDPDHVKSMPDAAESGSRALLHAYEVRFRQPFTGEELTISSLPQTTFWSGLTCFGLGFAMGLVIQKQPPQSG